MRHDPQRTSVRYGRRLTGARERSDCTRVAARSGGALSLRKGHTTPVYWGFGDGCGDTKPSRTSEETRATCKAWLDVEERFLRDGSVRELKVDCDNS